MAKWAKQDYEMVAGVIQDAVAHAASQEDASTREDQHALCERLAEQFAHRFRLDNPRFKSHLFHKACGTFPEEQLDAEMKRVEREGSN